MDDRKVIYLDDAIDAVNSLTYPSSLVDVKRKLAELPSAQLERKKGEWIDKNDGIDGAWNYCSVCGEQAIDLFDFCPNCGADMRGEPDV